MRPVNMTPGMPRERPLTRRDPSARPVAATRARIKQVSAIDCGGKMAKNDEANAFMCGSLEIRSAGEFAPRACILQQKEKNACCGKRGVLRNSVSFSKKAISAEAQCFGAYA